MSLSAPAWTSARAAQAALQSARLNLGYTQVRAPVLVLEVLSPSTAAYDRGDKFLSLQKLASLQEYALLDAGAARLEVFRRNAAGRFEHFVFEGADTLAELASIGWQGPVAALLD